MALVALGGMPLVAIGHANKQGSPTLGALSTTTLDAANEACIMVGRVVWEDFGSHTINTSGSSSLQWRSASSTFADGSTTLKVGLAPVLAGSPVRAANTTNVIDFDVSASFTGGGGGVTSAAWQTSVPTAGTKTIATGDLIAAAIQMTARGGADSVLVACTGPFITTTQPSVTNYVGASYADATRLPNMVLVASDGARGYFFGGDVCSIGSTVQIFNNTGTREYGNIMRFPFPVRAHGIVTGCDLAGATDLVLYSTPLGTPVAEKTISVALQTVGTSTSAGDGRFPFSSSFDLAANTDYVVSIKPTSATNVSVRYKTFDAAAHQGSEPLGTNCYAVNRSTGSFAAQNSSKDRFAIGLLVGAFDVGGSGGISRARAASGF